MPPVVGSAWQDDIEARPQPGKKGRILKTIAIRATFPHGACRCIARWCRGRGSNPYAAFRQAADFRHTAVFTASLRCSCAGLCLHRGADAVGAPRLVSTPSRVQAWLGVASDNCPGGSPNLRGFTQALSRAWCSICKSAVSTSFTTPAGAEAIVVLAIRARPWCQPRADASARVQSQCSHGKTAQVQPCFAGSADRVVIAALSVRRPAAAGAERLGAAAWAPVEAAAGGSQAANGLRSAISCTYQTRRRGSQRAPSCLARSLSWNGHCKLMRMVRVVYGQERSMPFPDIGARFGSADL